jgi:hypothetical protein
VKYPEQGFKLGKEVSVLVGEDIIEGVVVRSDKDLPCTIIVKLKDGRYLVNNEVNLLES